NPNFLALGCDDPTIFHYIQVTEITGSGKTIELPPVAAGSPPPVNQPQTRPKPLGTPVPNAVPQPPPTTVTPGKTAVDLIPLIDPARDPIHGRWLIVDKTLHCNDMHFVPRIQIPYQPAEEYDFIVTFSQPKPRNGVNLIMPNRQGGWFCLTT